MTSPCILTVVHKQVSFRLFFSLYLDFFIGLIKGENIKKHQSAFSLTHFMQYKRKKYIFIILSFPKQT